MGEDIVTATTVKDEELTTVADVKMIMSEDAEIKEDSNTEVDMQTTTEKVDMEENVEEVITEKWSPLRRRALRRSTPRREEWRRSPLRRRAWRILNQRLEWILKRISRVRQLPSH